MSSTLSAHSRRFDSKLVTLDHLRTLPAPEALGLRHKPIPHAVLVDGILSEIDRRGLVPVRQQYALGAKDHALFGVIDLQDKIDGLARGISFGFRSSTNSALAIKAVAGSRVFVCDNLVLSGDMIAFLRKSTIGLDFKSMLASGFDRFITDVRVLDTKIAELGATALTPAEAKIRIFDIFNSGILPVRLFDDVCRAYFAPSPDMTDCTPRTLWGLHNACTRAARELAPTRLFSASVQLGRLFGLTADRTVDAEVVSDGIRTSADPDPLAGWTVDLKVRETPAAEVVVEAPASAPLMSLSDKAIADILVKVDKDEPIAEAPVASDNPFKDWL